MKGETRLAPPNSIILVMDPKSGVVPEAMQGIVASTSSCAAVGTLAEMDGETTIRLRTGTNEAVAQPGTLVFDEEIAVSSGRMAVCTSRLETVLEIAVLGDRPRVRIWVNDPTEPSLIDIVVDG